jgi:hypothetical protein
VDDDEGDEGDEGDDDRDEDEPEPATDEFPCSGGEMITLLASKVWDTMARSLNSITSERLILRVIRAEISGNGTEGT